MKAIAFFVQGDLQISLTLWAMNQRRQDRYFVLCRDEARKHFKGMKNVKIIDTEYAAYSENPDIIFSLGYWKLIEKEYTERFIIINLHHSYNLMYRGRHMCSWAIINARKHNLWMHGTTLHKIDEELDWGEIIYSYSTPIYEGDTSYSLFQRCQILAEKMFKENYASLLTGNYKLKKLPKGKFCYRERDLSRYVDMNLSEIEIYDRVRALTFPGMLPPYTIIKGQIIELNLKSDLRYEQK